MTKRDARRVEAHRRIMAGVYDRAERLSALILKWDERRRANDWSGPTLMDYLVTALVKERRLERRREGSRPLPGRRPRP